MKILGSDYDGTLTQGGIGEEKLTAIRNWRKRGNKFGVISGRRDDFRKELARLYPRLEWDFFASFNGGYITDGKGNLIDEVRFSRVDPRKLAGDLLSWGCRRVYIFGEEYLCVSAEAEPQGGEGVKVCTLTEMPEVAWFHQVSAYLPDREGEAVAEQICRNYPGMLKPLLSEGTVDIVPAEVDKARALYRVMEFFGGRYEDVIAVGDNSNDMDMIREFHSYAMKNGVAQLQAAADGVIGDITELLEREG
ncbi:MAG: HAD family phosphatase [Oscillospiraceae bacterium]|nr:HAD family phosphatase [Oscillospiraceae bacterium]